MINNNKLTNQSNDSIAYIDVNLTSVINKDHFTNQMMD